MKLKLFDFIEHYSIIFRQSNRKLNNRKVARNILRQVEIHFDF